MLSPLLAARPESRGDSVEVSTSLRVQHKRCLPDHQSIVHDQSNVWLALTAPFGAVQEQPVLQEERKRSTHLSTPLYRDPHASVEERVENLLALMTLDEKLAQLGLRSIYAFRD